MKVPAKLNGYPILMSFDNLDGSHRILAYREGHEIHPFVVATYIEGDADGWFWGSYYKKLTSAYGHITKAKGE